MYNYSEAGRLRRAIISKGEKIYMNIVSEARRELVWIKRKPAYQRRVKNKTMEELLVMLKKCVFDIESKMADMKKRLSKGRNMLEKADVQDLAEEMLNDMMNDVLYGDCVMESCLKTIRHMNDRLICNDLTREDLKGYQKLCEYLLHSYDEWRMICKTNIGIIEDIGKSLNEPELFE